MAFHDETSLAREFEELRREVRELNIQAGSVEQRLAALSVKCLNMAENARTSFAGLAPSVVGMVPAIREAVRAEIKAARPLDEAWYEPSEVESLSGGKVRARTIRDWLRWGQIDGESDGREVRIYQDTVEALRKNKWRPLRPPDPSKTPPSLRRLRNLPN